MQTVLIIVHLLVTIALTIVILLQRSEGGALGIGGGGGAGGLFTARGAASALTRTTVALGILFFTTSLALTMLSLGGVQPTSILDIAPTGTEAPIGTAPGALPGLPQADPTAPILPALPGNGALPATPPAQ